jgi:SAM-dependent methyltransferase
MDALLPSLFGYHLIQMSASQTANLSAASPIHHCFKLVAGQKRVGEALHLYSSFDELPLESDSIDVVILHHVLEFSLNPHQILKEVNRVLIPRGHVIIVGFNPFSLFGIWKSLAVLFTNNVPWCYNTIGRHRLLDWFKLLDLKKSQVIDVFYRAPFSNPLLLDRLSFLEKIGRRLHLPTGGAYVMMACKDVNAMIPIRPSLKAAWESKLPKAIPGLAPTPSPRGLSHMASRRDKKLLH